MRLGIIARSDNTGLGNQTRELVRMLNPDKIMLIDSSYFNNNEQHPEWYDGIPTVHAAGFAKDKDVIQFLRGIDVVLSCEIFYNKKLVYLAKKHGIKTILQYNYEFLDNLQVPDMALPDMLLSPSTWNLDTVIKLFGRDTRILHLPPPSDFDLFKTNRDTNLSKDRKRILHVAGKIAAKDRNGTNTVIEMLKHSKADYELVIKLQKGEVLDCDDPRLTIDTSSPENREDLYNGFDAMVLPRRYAGLCLPMNEALMSGLPVFMTDISPNNAILPSGWLVEASKVDTLMTRTLLDVYEANPIKLAEAIDSYINMSDKQSWKNQAIQIGYDNFSVEVLKEKYLELPSLIN